MRTTHLYGGVKNKIMSIYMDNASTSYPKAPNVGKAICDYIENIGTNINRGSYNSANNTALDILDTREKILRLFNCDPMDCVTFNGGATMALNMVIQGYLSPNDHIIISSFEHNAVIRPLHLLKKIGIDIEVSIIPANNEGITNPDDIRALLKPNTRLVLVNHVSNVSGIIFPLEEVAKICTLKEIPLVVDGSQGAGHIPIDFKALNLSALCVPGHKGLLGPQGIGILILKKDFAKSLNPVITGGSGSKSHSEEMPSFLPDKFEAGTLNLPGIYGLDCSLNFLMEKGIDYFRKHELALNKMFINGIKDLPIRVIGRDVQNRVGVISIDFIGMDNGLVSKQLEDDFGILTRSGLHCSPIAHKTLGTYPKGTVRFSFGYTTNESQISICIEAIKSILNNNK